MKLVSYLKDLDDQLAILVKDELYDLNLLDKRLPDNMQVFLWEGEDAMNLAKEYDKRIKDGEFAGKASANIDDVLVLAPVPDPTSCRDGYAFRQHVEAARKNRGVEMIPEFDNFPIFYFTNHNAVQGPGVVECMPDHFDKLDFELEVACIIGREGRNIKAEDADQFIAGYCIMNDMSARGMQMEEMKLNLGPAKGKDFSTVIGPWLVTPDELEQFKVAPKDGHSGSNYKLNMRCWVNGALVSDGNMADMHWTFAEIIERCSYGVDMLPGDVIGSGTVGTGCFLEINGTGKRLDPNYTPKWLQENDVVEMEIEGLGRLQNIIQKSESDFSLTRKG